MIKLRKFFTAVVFLLLLSSVSYADKWETMTFTEDIKAGIEALNDYCVRHSFTAKDILWANNTSEENLKAGTVIYLPVTQRDMLAIWQNKGAYSDANPLRVSKAAQVQPVELPALKEKTPPSAPKNEQPAEVIAQTVKPEPAAVTPAPKKTQPAKLTAKPAKPDKILAAKPKKKAPEIPGLMDPIIILSPNGDDTHGPMRLMISGDKVEVVKLPQNAIPRKPSVSDANSDFSFVSYLPFYNNTPKPRVNNSIYTMNLNGKMLWPVDGKVSSPFGKWRGKHRHEGIDIPMPSGTPIRAAKSGVVARTGNNSTIGFRGYGNFVMLDHGNGLRSFYAHCQRVAVIPGQRIMQGEIIGYVGSTGRSTGPHLHFEIRVDNTKVNPIPYLSGNAHLASNK